LKTFNRELLLLRIPFLEQLNVLSNTKLGSLSEVVLRYPLLGMCLVLLAVCRVEELIFFPSDTWRLGLV